MNQAQDIIDMTPTWTMIGNDCPINLKSIQDIIEKGLDSVKHHETLWHMKRIWTLSQCVALLLKEEMWLTDEYIEYIWLVAPLHDIWKIWIPLEILDKAGPLTDEEYTVMKEHPILGWQILEYIRNIVWRGPILAMAQDIALYHHERYDWNWYPYGLKWNNIPLAARIASICDVIDVLKSTRVYKPEAFSDEKVYEIIKEWIWTYFDPEITKIVLENLPAILQIRRDFYKSSEEHL